MKRIIILLAVASLISGEAFAKRWSRSAAAAQGRQTGNQMGSQLSGDAQEGKSVDTAQHDSMAVAATNNMNNSNKGQATAYIMYGALGAAANAKFSICGGSGFTAYAACIAGGVLLGMALQSKREGDSFDPVVDNSIGTYCEYNNVGCSTANPPPNPYADVTPSVPDIDKTTTDVQTGLSENGYSVDVNSGKVKTPDGKEIDPRNKASLEAALGAEGAAALMATVAQAQKDALAKTDTVKPTVASLGFEGGGGGGGEIGEAIGYEDGLTAAQKDALRAAKIRKPAQVSGLSKNYNGDPIGVAADNIFAMMTRRYKLKDTQKTFFGPEAR